VAAFFIITAALGFGLLLVGLFFDGFLEFMDADTGILSLPVIGAFLGAFGIGGFVGTSVTSNALVGLVAAGVAGFVLGWIALRLSLAFIGMHTDATPTSGDFHGQIGRVVTNITDAGGEILIRSGGSPVKLVARADRPIERGVEVVVIEVLSATSVRVMTTSDLLEQE
jgi:membrane-bound ClpP family serine protease